MGRTGRLLALPSLHCVTDGHGLLLRLTRSHLLADDRALGHGLTEWHLTLPLGRGEATDLVANEKPQIPPCRTKAPGANVVDEVSEHLPCRLGDGLGAGLSRGVVCGNSGDALAGSKCLTGPISSSLPAIVGDSVGILSH